MEGGLRVDLAEPGGKLGVGGELVVEDLVLGDEPPVVEPLHEVRLGRQKLRDDADFGWGAILIRRPQKLWIF